MKLNDILNMAKFNVTPDKEQMKESIKKAALQRQAPNKRRIKGICAGAAAAVILLGLGFFTWKYFTFDPSTNIAGDISALSRIVYVKPDRMTAKGVETNTTVTLVTDKSMSAEEIKSHIAVTPAVDFTVQKKSINRYRLKFAEDLSTNTSYTISSVDNSKTLYRWSLQTEAAFEIDNAYPGDADVDISTGIEITFSESSVNAFGEYFSIYPEVSGKFSHKGRTWIFTPDHPLKPYTTYDVSVSGEIENGRGEQLGHDYTFSFTTGADEQRYAYIMHNTFDITDTFAATETPIAELRHKGIKASSADMTVYRIPDADTYIKLHEKYDKKAIISTKIAEDISQLNLQNHSHFTAGLIPDGQDSEHCYFSYPKALESGYYLTEITWEDIKMYQFVQSSDLAVYAAAQNGQYTVWVNNIQSKLPVENATVTINNVTAATDKDGLTELSPKIDKDSEHVFIRVKADSFPEYVICSQAGGRDTFAGNDYYSYFYTNSTLYRTTDTVKVWGVLFNRSNDVPTPEVKLYADWNQTEYPVSIRSDNTFTAEIPIQNYKLSDGTQLELRINGDTVRGKYLAIEDYQLPTYRLSAKSDKRAYFAGETENFNLSAEYYDGTPAANLELYANDAADVTVTTDNQGKALFTLPAEITDDNSADTSAPQFSNECFVTKSALDDTYFADHPVIRFATPDYLGIKLSDQTDRACTLTVTTADITVDRLNALTDAEFAGLYSLNEEELAQYYIGAPTAKNVVIETHAVSYDRVKTGTYYDPLLKKIQLQYDYTEKDEIVHTQPLQTQNGKLTLKDVKIPSADGYVYFRVTTTDRNGKPCHADVYVSRSATSDRTEYAFDCRDTALEGDSVSLSIINTATHSKVTDGSYVYHIVNQKSYKTAKAQGSTTFDFTADSLPRIALFGAYFDGTHIVAVRQSQVGIDLDTRKLKIKITPNKTSYLPGDTVKLHLETLNAADEPIAAAYNINVFDKSLLTVAENPADILTSLYESYFPDNFVTNIPQEYYGEGGGGAQPMRDNFEDTPAFICGHTDKKGVADVSFELSSSVTTWVAAAQGITSKMEAGSSQIEFAATKDLFTVCKVQDYKTTDDAVISFRVNGKAISPEAVIDANITLKKDESVIRNENINFTAASEQYFNFGKLAEGEYTVTITAKNGTLQDAVRHEFSVKPSLLTVPTISNKMTGTGAADLILMNSAQAKYAELVNRLLNCPTIRLDQKIGYDYANALWNQFDSEPEKRINWDYITDYNIANGFIPYKQNTKPDVLLSARVASLFPEAVGLSVSEDYFDQVTTNPDATTDDVLCALWGNAAMHRATEKDLEYYYGEGNAFTTRQYLLFALGYAYGGNQTKAIEIYNSHIKSEVKKEGDIVYIGQKDSADSEKDNALLCMLLSRISSADAYGSLCYAMAHDSDTMLSSLEIVAYLKEYIPMLEGENTVKITYAAQSVKTVSFASYALYSERIAADKAADIKVEQISGDTIAKTNRALTIGEIKSTGKVINPIACTMQPTANIGDLIDITVNITPEQSTAGSCKIKLPAGIKYLDQCTSNAGANVCVGADKSVLTINVSSGKADTIILHCRAVLPGSFELEPIVTAGQSNAVYASAPLPIAINPAV